MHKKYFLIVLILIAAVPAMAQGLLKGTVYESGSNNRMSNVFIRNNNNKQITITDNSGNFSIKAETGNLIIFDSPGFISDTLYLIDLVPKKIMMVTKTIALREVSITSTRQAFDPHKEYPEIYTKSKVYIMSPTSWFSKEGRDARKLKRYFVTEEQQRHVDAVFTRAYVGSIVPLKGRDLEDFMTLYRPSYAFIRGNNSESLAVYINDSYKKYQALSPEKRHLPALTSDVKIQQ
ncbi:MAG TPA: hypothetical protein VNW95_16285 [Mucilaginibacter sp.]|jgi:hypothetical protein|nr:hypothetical protein [Mucilaginibacter sp.]